MLQPAAGASAAAPNQKVAGGLVGGYIQLGTDDDENLNRSWSANASYLPLQCARPLFRNGTILECPKDDPLLCSNGHCPRGLTIELLIRLGKDALKQGNRAIMPPQ